MTQATTRKVRKPGKVTRRSFIKTAATGTALASGVIGAPYINAQAKAKLVVQTRPARFTKLEQMKASFIAKFPDADIEFIALAGGGASGPGPRIHHACLTIENFELDRVIATLEEFGITPRGNGSGPAGPLQSNVAMRMEDRGGAPGGTPELYFTDPDGISIQLQDANYCGGGGFLGDVCG